MVSGEGGRSPEAGAGAAGGFLLENPNPRSDDCFIGSFGVLLAHLLLSGNKTSTMSRYRGRWEVYPHTYTKTPPASVQLVDLIDMKHL